MILDLPNTADTTAHVIQVALTPIFLLSGIASLLGVFSGRLARVADRVDDLAEKLDGATDAERPRLERRLNYLRRRSHTLDIAVVLGAIAGGSTCVAALLLFVGTLRDLTGATLLFAAFGMALICTAGALAAYLVEMLMASRGIRDLSRPEADEPDLDGDPPELPETSDASIDAGSG